MPHGHNPLRVAGSSMLSSTYRKIECFGLCGAGKTTVLSALEPYLVPAVSSGALAIARPTAPAASASRRHTLLLISKLLLQHPLTMSQFILRDRINRNLIKKLGYRWASMKMQSNDMPLLLVDCGVIQPLVSFVIENQIADEHLPFRSFINLFPSPLAAIYFRCQPETALERYVHREKIDRQRPMRSNLGSVDLASRFETGFELCQLLAEHFRQAGTPVIEIDTEHPLSPQMSQQISEQLVTVVGSGTGPGKVRDNDKIPFSECRPKL